THRNPNLLNWRKELWLIDHGASLYFHHAWANWQNYVSKPFPRLSDHVLLARANQLAEGGEQMQATLTEEVINGILAMIPEDWLQADGWEGSHEEKRSVYRSFLLQRLELMPDLIQEAEHARKKGI
ncbi:MAG: aminotransferase class I and II, partial [Bacteroidota bacterium]